MPGQRLVLARQPEHYDIGVRAPRGCDEAGGRVAEPAWPKADRTQLPCDRLRDIRDVESVCGPSRVSERSIISPVTDQPARSTATCSRSSGGALPASSTAPGHRARRPRRCLEQRIKVREQAWRAPNVHKGCRGTGGQRRSGQAVCAGHWRARCQPPVPLHRRPRCRRKLARLPRRVCRRLDSRGILAMSKITGVGPPSAPRLCSSQT